MLQHLQPAEEALGRKLNPTCYTLQEFEQRRADPGSFVTLTLGVKREVFGGLGSGLAICPPITAVGQTPHRNASLSQKAASRPRQYGHVIICQAKGKT